MVSIYTISRQYGSGGSSFAKLLSSKSGYPLVWREVINQAAIQMGSPELALAMIDELNLFDLNPDETTYLVFIDSIRKIMHEFAGKGNQIIVGRASQIILSDFPNVLRIRIIASKQTRIKNICKSKNVNFEAATAQIEKSDSFRSNYLKKFYNVDWNDPSLYDVIINTDHVMIDAAVEWILHFPGK
jgi:cytidylate kinase